MKKGKNILTGVVIVILLAAIMTTALVAGYKFVTFINRDTEEKFHEVAEKANDTSKDKLGFDFLSLVGKEEKEELRFEYDVQNTRTYTGKKIYEKAGIIYNDSGEYLTDFIQGDGYSIYMITDVDHKYGVFDIDNTSYLVNADLEIMLTLEDCDNILINYEGTFIYYENHEGLFRYNIESGESAKVANRTYNYLMSPDGKTVVFSEYGIDKSGLYVQGMDGEKRLIDDAKGEYFAVKGVSNDGNTVFYKKGNWLYCYHDGKIKKLSNGYIRECLFDRECSQILFRTDKKTYYYKPGDKKARKLVKDDGYGKIDILSPYQDLDTIYLDSRIIDTDCFSDAIIIRALKNTYCFDGYEPETVTLNRGEYVTYAGIYDGTPTCIYNTDGNLMKSVYRDGTVEKEIIVKDVSMFSDNIAMTDDLSEGIYTVYSGGYDVINGHVITGFDLNGKNGVEIHTGNHRATSIIWSSVFNRFYYILNDKLYSTNGDGSDNKLIMEHCQYFGYIPNHDSPILANDDGVTFLVIGDEILKVD